jgi:Transglycosylase SLT domain
MSTRLRSAVPAQAEPGTTTAVPVDGPVEGRAQVVEGGAQVVEGRAQVRERAPDDGHGADVATGVPDTGRNPHAEPVAPPAGRHRSQARAGRRLRAARRSVAAWPRRPSARVVVPGLLIFAAVGVSVFAGAYLVPAWPTSTHRAFSMINPTTPDPDAPAVPGAGVPRTDPSATASLPPAGTGTQAPGGSAKPSDLAAWAAPLAGRLGIPLPAMQAYGYAELVTTATQPSCQLRWTTLAGIGKIESNHGQDRATLAPDGKALPPIIGAPLNGLGGRAAVADTDGGTIDGDRTWDHAVGPMQFIPSTWNKYAVDADGDGVADINDVNDAALAAARYLCAGNRNLSVAGDWWAAILSYNAVQAYAQDVFAAANDYGLRSR